MRFLHFLLIFLAFSMLSAASAAAAECPGADQGPDAASPVAVRAAVVCLSNAERAQHGLSALIPEGRLEAAAQAYGERLVGERFFAHVAPDGNGLLDRLGAYREWLRVGENLAWGEGTRATPRSIVAAWMTSPTHRANLLSDAFREVGIGTLPGTPIGSAGPSGTYVAEYGSRVSDDAPWPVEGAVRASAAAAGAALVTPAPRFAKKAPTSSSKARTSSKKSTRRCRRGTSKRLVKVRGRRVVRCVRTRKAKKRSGSAQASRSRKAASVLQNAKSS